MPFRRKLAIVWTIGAFLVTLWSWAFFVGPFRWAAEWQLEHFGSYEVKLTLFAALIVLLIPAGFLSGGGKLGSPQPRNPAVRLANARRNARHVAILGLLALAVAAVGGTLGYLKMRTPLTQADLVLTTGAEPAPEADLVAVTGVARTDLSVGYQETVAGVTSVWSFVPLVGAGWRPGDPIRFVLRTNQTAWLPPAGSSAGPGAGAEGLHMLRHGAPPFRMITGPSVLRRHDLPGAVRTEFEKNNILLDPSLAVVEQSAGEVYEPYWLVAAGGGLIGVCLLLGGLLGSVNARKTARA